MRTLLKAAAAEVPDHRFSNTFLLAEWEDVVDAQQLVSWEAYRDAKRIGRKTRLPEKRRAVLWQIFEGVRRGLGASEQITLAELWNRLAEVLASQQARPFDFAVVDEAQDLSMSQLRFLAAGIGLLQVHTTRRRTPSETSRKFSEGGSCFSPSRILIRS